MGYKMECVLTGNARDWVAGNIPRPAEPFYMVWGWGIRRLSDNQSVMMAPHSLFGFTQMYYIMLELNALHHMVERTTKSLTTMQRRSNEALLA